MIRSWSGSRFGGLLSGQRLGGALLLLFSLGYGLEATRIPLDFFSEQEPFNARSLPVALAVIGVLLSSALLLAPSAATDWRTRLHLHWGRGAGLLLAMLLYAACLEGLGFVVATTLFLLAGLLIMGERRPRVLLAASLPLPLLLPLLMSYLDIRLSVGTWWQG